MKYFGPAIVVFDFWQTEFWFVMLTNRWQQWEILMFGNLSHLAALPASDVAGPICEYS